MFFVIITPMITSTQAQQYLASVGITIPAFMLDALLEQANSIEECLALHYTPATATLIQAYLLALFALGQGDKFVSSEGAPSGASRSYRYNSFADRWKASVSLLRNADKHGCASHLVPEDPTVTASGGMWISR